MISKRTRPEGSDATHGNSLRGSGRDTRIDTRGSHGSQASGSGPAVRDHRDDAPDRDGGTSYVVPNAIDRDDDR